MKNATKIALVIFALALVFTVNFVSAADFPKTWDCNNGLGGCINYPLYSARGVQSWFCGSARPVYEFKPESNFKFSEYFFSVTQAGTYDCVVSITETGYGYYDGAQTNENSDVWLNENYLGRTKDDICNSGTLCHDCTNSVTSFPQKRLTLKATGNKIKLESFDSHGLRSVSINCNKIPVACVPSTEICDGLDNDCDGSVDEGIANISTGTNVGLCQSEIKQCMGGNFSVVQNIVVPVAENCGNMLDDDCDGYSDNNDSDCDVPVCNNGNKSDNVFLNNYCNNSQLWNNFSFNLCESNSWSLRFNQSFNFSCPYGCLNGQCVNQPNYSLSVNIIYPTNGTVFASNSSVYEINLNTTSNQLVGNWSINGNNYFDSSVSFAFNVKQNISFGINNFTVCGTNVNGTDCDFVFVILKNDFNQTNSSLFVDIISPENKTYDEREVPLNISSNGAVWYEFNGMGVIYNGVAFLNSLEGRNNLTAYAIDDEGNVVSDSRVFFVDLDDGNAPDEDCDDECKNCDEEELESFDSIFMSDEDDLIYLTQNNTNGLVLNNKNEFVFKDLILLLLLLILILGILILTSLIARFLRDN